MLKDDAADVLVFALVYLPKQYCVLQPPRCAERQVDITHCKEPSHEGLIDSRPDGLPDGRTGNSRDDYRIVARQSALSLPRKWPRAWLFAATCQAHICLGQGSSDICRAPV